jgi:hypothetical protein
MAGAERTGQKMTARACRISDPAGVGDGQHTAGSGGLQAGAQAQVSAAGPATDGDLRHRRMPQPRQSIPGVTAT